MSGLKIIDLNVQSILNTLDSLELFLKHEKPDIFCVSEHHLHPLTKKLANLAGYRVASIFCRKKKIRGGVAIFSRLGISCKEIDLTSYSIERDCEMTAVQIHELDVLIITIYRSPKGNFEHFLEIIDRILTEFKAKNLILCGDFNIDFSEENNDRRKLEFLDLTTIYNMHASIKEPTRVGKTSATIIDNFFTTFLETDYTARVVDPGISDHRAQIFKTSFKLSNPGELKTLVGSMIRKYNDESID